MSDEMKNMYEQLILEVVINEIPDMTEELKYHLACSTTESKRSQILAILEENNIQNRQLFRSIRKQAEKDSFFTGQVDSTNHVANIVTMLRDYVKVSKTEKKAFGEVMTPIELVEDMLNTLPAEVWTNPDLKWLDPCNGVGIFPAIVVQRLMNGLKEWQPDANMRYQHIMEEMIYVCELQAKNLLLYMYAFDPEDKLDLNIYNGSFLDDGFDKHMKRYCGVEKFDVVVMNPPYNDSTNQANILWDKFVEKTLQNKLVESGLLVAVHPNGWRNVDGKLKKLQNILKTKRISYLEMHDSNDGQKTFNATTNYDFYCLYNVNDAHSETTIKFQTGVTESKNISDMEFIPNGMLDNIEKLIAKDDEEKVEVIHSYSYEPRKEYMSDDNNENFKYPCVYSIKKGGIATFKYSSVNNKGHFKIPKIILGNGANPTYLIDRIGEYGMTQWVFGIVDDVENFEQIEKALQSDKMKEITQATKFVSTNGNPIIYPKIISLFRKDFWKEFI